MLCSAAITSFSTRFPVGLTQETYRYNVKTHMKKECRKNLHSFFKSVRL